MPLRRSAVLYLGLLTGIVTACAHRTVSSSPLVSKACRPRVVGIGTRGGGVSTLSATTQAIYTLKTADSTIRGYIIAARGQPYWFEGTVFGSGRSRINASGKREDTWRSGRYSYTVVYDSISNSIELAGTRVALDTGLLVLLDRVDSVGGKPSVVGSICPAEVQWDNPVRPLLEALPALRRYAGSDAGA